MNEINTIPPISPVWKIAGWSFPVLILGAIFFIGIQKGQTAAGDNIIYWILAHSIPAALGGLLALAPPFTLLAVILAAPLTSLTPLVGAGYVAAFVQVLVNSPLVREFETAGDDTSTFRGWWQNKLLRVLLVFILTSLGSSLGTSLGGYQIIKNLF